MRIDFPFRPLPTVKEGKQERERHVYRLERVQRKKGDNSRSSGRHERERNSKADNSSSSRNIKSCWIASSVMDECININTKGLQEKDEQDLFHMLCI